MVTAYLQYIQVVVYTISEEFNYVGPLHCQLII